jgi:hypothetical protein
MTTGLTYSSYVQQISTLAVVPSSDTNFQIVLPMAISYAELRMMRDLDFLSSQVYDNTSFTTTTSNNLLTIPTSAFITLQTIQVNSNGVLKPLTPVAKEYIQNVFNSAASAGVPTVFAVYGGDSATTGNTSQYILLGPYPDASYPLTLTGTVHAASLSATNTTTFISTYLPDLFIAASMVYIGGYQRNFSSTGADQQMPVNWEQQYQTLLKGATVEEYRKKFQSAAWGPQSPSPIATPQRG